jgi:hypothetical protein
VVVQLSSKITYQLWAGNGRDGVSGWFCSYPARSRTNYGRAMGETESAGGGVAIQQDHVLAVGGRWKRRSQRAVVQLSSEITYFLWAGDGSQGVSGRLCSYPVRLRTSCRRAMERQSQRVIVQLSSKITYFLWAGNGRDSVSGWFCSQRARSRTSCGRAMKRDAVSGWLCGYRARLHTNCGQAMGDTKSAGGPAAIQQDHVQTVSRRWEKQSQRVVVQLSSKIAYRLCAGDGGETGSAGGPAAIE